MNRSHESSRFPEQLGSFYPPRVSPRFPSKEPPRTASAFGRHVAAPSLPPDAGVGFGLLLLRRPLNSGSDPRRAPRRSCPQPELTTEG